MGAKHISNRDCWRHLKTPKEAMAQSVADWPLRGAVMATPCEYLQTKQKSNRNQTEIKHEMGVKPFWCWIRDMSASTNIQCCYV